MIPVRLNLRNFLSYADATVELGALQTACIYGANGAGKSALLEALTWALWGQCRVNDDALIRQGATIATVDLVYQHQGQVYRVLRSRSRGSGNRLEWQIDADGQWRVLTHKTQRATQQAIIAHLKLDYDTFINTAYLRQGRADEFTLKRPAERKRLLAEMLNLQAYERLADQCRDQARTAKAQLETLQQHSQTLLAQQTPHLTERIATLEATLAALDAEQAQASAHLEAAQATAHDRQLLQHELASLDLATTEAHWRQQRQRLQDLQNLNSQAARIEQGHHEWQIAHQQLGQWQERQQAAQTLEQQWQSQERDWQAQQRQYALTLETWQLRRSRLESQVTADLAIVAQAETLQTALQQYRQAQANLSHYDRLQQQAQPLLDRLMTYQHHLQAAREQVSLQQQRLAAQLHQSEQADQELANLRTALAETEHRLAERTALRTYQQQLLAKGQERRAFVAELQARQRTLQTQWQRLSHLQQHLEAPAQVEGNLSLFTPCPLCEHPLQPQDRQRVIANQAEHLSEITEDLWVIREQLAVSDREIEVLRQEYQAVSDQVAQFDEQLALQGRHQQQLSDREAQSKQRQQLQTELDHLTTALATKQFAPDLHTELERLHSELTSLGYDEKDHALARSEVSRWRWAALKQSELRQARERLQHSQPQLQEGPPDPPARPPELAELEVAIANLNYDPHAHQQAQHDLARLSVWVSQYQALQQAQSELATCQQQCHSLSERLQQQRQRHNELQQQLAQLPPERDLVPLRQNLAQRRQTLHTLLAELGACRHQHTQQQQHQQDLNRLQADLKHHQHQQQVWQELSTAYGPNGIPAMIIESVLPELEREANTILSRLSDQQLHLSFKSQRRRSLDSLDILIADTQGSRPYESYSGGEAFRINFAIRLALSRLLAQRAGATLQTLWIDEGFGSQDEAGREQLVAAINAVAADFASILVITHLPSLRDRFPSRLQVTRGAQGSSVELIA